MEEVTGSIPVRSTKSFYFLPPSFQVVSRLTRPYVVDGGKALAAVRRHAGEAAFIQRCQVHKRRNVVDPLPEEHKSAVKKKLQNAYAMTEYADAKRALERLHRELMELNPSAIPVQSTMAVNGRKKSKTLFSCPNRKEFMKTLENITAPSPWLFRASKRPALRGTTCMFRTRNRGVSRRLKFAD